MLPAVREVASSPRRRKIFSGRKTVYKKYLGRWSPPPLRSSSSSGIFFSTLHIQFRARWCRWSVWGATSAPGGDFSYLDNVFMKPKAAEKQHYITAAALIVPVDKFPVSLISPRRVSPGESRMSKCPRFILICKLVFCPRWRDNCC